MWSETMDPKIWSQLPRELLCEVIYYANRAYDNTEDRDVLWQRWVDTARGNRILHGALMAQHWAQIHFSWTQLCLSPDEERVYEADDTSAENYTARREKLSQLLHESGSSTGLLQEMLELDHDICPAQFSRRLELLFFQTDALLEDYLPPSHHTIQHTLRLILPAMKNLRNVVITGPPSDVIFDALAKLDPSQLHKLEMLGNWCSYNYRSAATDRNLDIYDWTKLSGLKALTELKISYVSKDEARSLAETIPKLQSLRILSVKPRHNATLNSPFDEAYSTPLQVLLCPVDSNDHGLEPSMKLLTQLPASLTQLIIQDHYFLGHSALRIPKPDDRADLSLSHCRLKSLDTELDDLECTRNILDWLPGGHLERVSFSPVLASTDQSEDTLTKPLAVTDEIISTHLCTLREIIIQNIWKANVSYAMEFTKRWDSQFRLTDLVLGSDCIPVANCPEPHDEYKTRSLKHVLFGCEEDTHRWGVDIERIRLELPWVAHDIDWAAPDLWLWCSMQKVRILIVSPYTDCTEGGKLPEKHHEILQGIIWNAPKSLKYVRICGQAWWVDDEVDDRRNFVSFYHAYNGEGEFKELKKKILEWITPEDEEFILPDSHLNIRRQGGYKRQRMDGSPRDQFLLQACNFMVARLNERHGP